MKSLSTEKRAIDLIKQMISDGQISQGVVEKYFPELKELEDERIRKELLEHCINRRDGKQVCVDASDYRRWANWLEKQDKSVAYYEDKLDRCACENFNKGYKKALEKQGKQKPITKVESKFHEDDWIVAYLEKLSQDGLKTMELMCQGLKKLREE